MSASRALVTMYEGEAEVLRSVTLPVLEDHAAAHGYAIEHAPPIAGLPHSWARVPAIRSALRRHDEVVWLDADALILKPEANPFTAMPADADVVTAWDCRFGMYCFTMGFRDTLSARRVLANMWARRHDDHGRAQDQGALNLVRRSRSCRATFGVFADPWSQRKGLRHPEALRPVSYPERTRQLRAARALTPGYRVDPLRRDDRVEESIPGCTNQRFGRPGPPEGAAA